MNINTFNSMQSDIKSLSKLALPLVSTNLIGACIGFFQTVFLSHVNHQAMAAGALVSWLFGLFIVIMFGTLSAINVLIAHKHGAKDDASISLIMRDGLFLSIILTIPSIFLFWNMAPIFLLFGQEPSLVELTKPYLHALVWGLLPAFVVGAFIELFIGLGHTKQVMYITIISVILTLFFSFIFIFGLLGMPKLGIAGSGLGATLGYWIVMLILIIFFVIRRDYHVYFTKIFCINKPLYMIEILKIGLPMGIMFCFEVGFFFALTLVAGSISPYLLSANQIALQYMGTLMSVIFGIAQAITVRMGHLLGAHDRCSAKNVKNAGIVLSLIFMTIWGCVYLFFPKFLISMDFDVNDVQNANIVKLTEQIFIISAVFQLFEGIRIALFGALRALGDTKFTLISSVFSFWVIALPVGYLFAVKFNFGGQGLWLGMVFGAIISSIFLWLRFNFIYKLK